MKDQSIKMLQNEFDRIDNIFRGGADLIFWGTGNTASIYWEDYEKEKIEPSFWVDSDAEKQKIGFNGYDVFAPDELLKRSNYLVVIFSAIPSTFQNICKSVEQYTDCYCSAEALYYYKHQDELFEFISKLNDDKSKKNFTELLLCRVFGEFLSAGTKEGNDYFPFYQFSTYSDEEVFVDCGGFKGDTIEKYMFEKYGIFKNYYAFEPIKSNYDAMKYRVERLEKEWALTTGQVICENMGVGDKQGIITLRWNTSVAASASAPGIQSVDVPIITLDSYFAEKKISFIKADIEGEEYHMLRGAEKVIRRDKPLLAICIYHKLSDYFTIPQFIDGLGMGYKLDVRCHSDYFAETVLYAW